MRIPVVARKLIDAHALARRCVYEFAAAEVDAAVRRAFFIRLEEDEVALFKLRRLRALSELELLVRRAWQRHAVLLEDVLQVARAVERLRRCAAEFVRRADVLLRRRYDGRHLGSLQERGALGRFFYARFERGDVLFARRFRCRIVGRLHSGKGDRAALRGFCGGRRRGGGGVSCGLLLQAAPCLAVDDARFLEALGALERKNRALRAAAEDAVRLVAEVARALQFLLQLEDVVSVGVFREDRRGQDRARRQEYGKSESKKDFAQTTEAHTIPSFPRSGNRLKYIFAFKYTVKLREVKPEGYRLYASPLSLKERIL